MYSFLEYLSGGTDTITNSFYMWVGEQYMAVFTKTVHSPYYVINIDNLKSWKQYTSFYDIECIDSPKKEACKTCNTCNDTHTMYVGEYPVMWTHCPVPCAECKNNPQGAYCKNTPCFCACHKKA